MKYISFKYFGTLATIISVAILLIVQFIFKVNIIFINTIGKTPFYIWLGIVLAFIIFSAFNNTIKTTTLNWIYLLLTGFSFIYFNSMFQWSVKCCPEKHESMYDWNASKGLHWIVAIPVSFGIVLVLGFFYDIFKTRDLKSIV